MADQGDWSGDAELFDLAEGETANSIAVLNALDEPIEGIDDDVTNLQATSITSELHEIDPDLHARWTGALFSLNAQNPDAARHFCTSSREILRTIIETRAPDRDVIAVNPQCARTPNGTPTRQARIEYCLSRKGLQNTPLADFVNENITNVITLFDELNPATHGRAGRYDLYQLRTIKNRVEGAIQFLHRIAT
jgi:hypothetical protein